MDKEIQDEIEECMMQLQADGYERGVDWNGYEVYVPDIDVSKLGLCIGLPLVVLVKGNEVRISDSDECMEYLRYELKVKRRRRELKPRKRNRHKHKYKLYTRRGIKSKGKLKLPDKVRNKIDKEIQVKIDKELMLLFADTAIKGIDWNGYEVYIPNLKSNKSIYPSAPWLIFVKEDEVRTSTPDERIDYFKYEYEIKCRRRRLKLRQRNRHKFKNKPTKEQ